MRQAKQREALGDDLFEKIQSIQTICWNILIWHSGNAYPGCHDAIFNLGGIFLGFMVLGNCVHDCFRFLPNGYDALYL